jgi:hypothetical protein
MIPHPETREEGWLPIILGCSVLFWLWMAIVYFI